jgi:hypothetical protein
MMVFNAGLSDGSSITAQAASASAGVAVRTRGVIATRLPGASVYRAATEAIPSGRQGISEIEPDSTAQSFGVTEEEPAAEAQNVRVLSAVPKRLRVSAGPPRSSGAARDCSYPGEAPRGVRLSPVVKLLARLIVSRLRCGCGSPRRPPDGPRARSDRLVIAPSGLVGRGASRWLTSH